MRRGQAIVEFALILPAFILLCVGFLSLVVVVIRHDFALLRAAQTAAQAAAQGRPESEALNLAREVAAEGGLEQVRCHLQFQGVARGSWVIATCETSERPLGIPLPQRHARALLEVDR